jgi:hypothetical protein
MKTIGSLEPGELFLYCDNLYMARKSGKPLALIEDNVIDYLKAMKKGDKVQVVGKYSLYYREPLKVKALPKVSKKRN